MIFFFTNFLRIKLLDFFLNSQNYRMNHIFPDILLNPKKNVKILETRPQSSKNTQKIKEKLKIYKISKIHDVHKSTLVFWFQFFLRSILKLSRFFVVVENVVSDF